MKLASNVANLCVCVCVCVCVSVCVCVFQLGKWVAAWVMLQGTFHFHLYCFNHKIVVLPVLALLGYCLKNSYVLWPTS
jgi:hypothetical protein